MACGGAARLPPVMIWTGPNRSREPLPPMPVFPLPHLASARLRLRLLAAADAPLLFGIYSDPAVMRYWSTPPWAEMSQAETHIAEAQAAYAAGTGLTFGIEQNADHRLIGTCQFYQINDPCRRAELGYALAKSAWGQGVMHEALTLLIGHGFGALGLNRIEADIDPRNTASAACLERLGFTKEGHLRERWIVAGEVSDSGLYGLLQRDWLKVRGEA